MSVLGPKIAYNSVVGIQQEGFAPKYCRLMSFIINTEVKLSPSEELPPQPRPQTPEKPSTSPSASGLRSPSAAAAAAAAAAAIAGGDGGGGLSGRLRQGNYLLSEENFPALGAAGGGGIGGGASALISPAKGKGQAGKGTLASPVSPSGNPPPGSEFLKSGGHRGASLKQSSSAAATAAGEVSRQAAAAAIVPKVAAVMAEAPLVRPPPAVILDWPVSDKVKPTSPYLDARTGCGSEMTAIKNRKLLNSKLLALALHPAPFSQAANGDALHAGWGRGPKEAWYGGWGLGNCRGRITGPCGDTEPSDVSGV